MFAYSSSNKFLVLTPSTAAMVARVSSVHRPIRSPRAELLAKVNDIAAGIADWQELLTGLVEGFPPTASNLAQVAKLGAGLLMQEAVKLVELSQKLTEPMTPPAVVARMGEEVRS